MKIRKSSEGPADVGHLFFDFRPSKHIFAGLGENFPNVVFLYIIDQGIKFVERNNFIGLQKLENLFMRDNQIEFLPEDVFNDLSSLKRLYLTNNFIMELPEKLFMNLINIEEIGFDGNHIKSLPTNLFLNNLNLKMLTLYCDELKLNDFDLSAMPNVKLFNITHCVYYFEGKLGTE